ncbi:MAG: PEP-CTERM sorting domain-containing protein [Gammaproteobacteria bacterium]|nr:PEP-CTERM sorting domain-containing protein [Gammaproteobacteria bacterium]
MKNTFHSWWVGAALLLGAASAQAVILNPGDMNIPLPGTTVAAEPNLAGTVVVDELTAFTISGASGVVQNRVVLAVDGTYDFYWRVMVDENSTNVIGSFRIGEFYTSVYDVNYRIDGLGDVAPTMAHRFSGTQASYVNFVFGNPLSAGQSSNFMFVDTDATAYAKTAFYDLTSTGSGNISVAYSGYAPARSVDVPEPEVLLLLSLGLAGMVLGKRKRS